MTTGYCLSKILNCQWCLGLWDCSVWNLDHWWKTIWLHMEQQLCDGMSTERVSVTATSWVSPACVSADDKLLVWYYEDQTLVKIDWFICIGTQTIMNVPLSRILLYFLVMMMGSCWWILLALNLFEGNLVIQLTLCWNCTWICKQPIRQKTLSNDPTCLWERGDSTNRQSKFFFVLEEVFNW